MKHFLKTTINSGILAALLLGAGAPAMAQNADKQGQHKTESKLDRKDLSIAERVERRLAQLDKQLDLSDAQVAQLRPILTEDITKLQEARLAMKAARKEDKSQNNAAAQAARADMKAQLHTTKDRISAILTPEQREKAAAKIKVMREHVSENIKERRQAKMQEGKEK